MRRRQRWAPNDDLPAPVIPEGQQHVWGRCNQCGAIMPDTRPATMRHHYDVCHTIGAPSQTEVPADPALDDQLQRGRLGPAARGERRS